MCTCSTHVPGRPCLGRPGQIARARASVELSRADAQCVQVIAGALSGARSFCGLGGQHLRFKATQAGVRRQGRPASAIIMRIGRMDMGRKWRPFGGHLRAATKLSKLTRAARIALNSCRIYYDRVRCEPTKAVRKFLGPRDAHTLLHGLPERCPRASLARVRYTELNKPTHAARTRANFVQHYPRSRALCTR
jgi:hypothetical protein